MSETQVFIVAPGGSIRQAGKHYTEGDRIELAPREVERFTKRGLVVPLLEHPTEPEITADELVQHPAVAEILAEKGVELEPAAEQLAQEPAAEQVQAEQQAAPKKSGKGKGGK